MNELIAIEGSIPSPVPSAHKSFISSSHGGLAMGVVYLESADTEYTVTGFNYLYAPDGFRDTRRLPFISSVKRLASNFRDMEKEKTIDANPLAGSELLPEATNNNLSNKDAETCAHAFVIEKNLLRKKTFYTESEILACVVYCKNCGRLGGSSRINS